MLYDSNNPPFIYFFNHPKSHRYIFSLFTFYYTIQNKRFYPIAMSKPNSTQKPFYYLLQTHPSFPTLQSLLNHYIPLNPLS